MKESPTTKPVMYPLELAVDGAGAKRTRAIPQHTLTYTHKHTMAVEYGVFRDKYRVSEGTPKFSFRVKCMRFDECTLVTIGQCAWRRYVHKYNVLPFCLNRNKASGRTQKSMHKVAVASKTIKADVCCSREHPYRDHEDEIQVWFIKKIALS